MLYWSAKALGQWVTVLPRSLREEVAKQVERAREVWRGDREEGRPGVWLPGALARLTGWVGFSVYGVPALQAIPWMD